jgi:hypothetical protein
MAANLDRIRGDAASRPARRRPIATSGPRVLHGPFVMDSAASIRRAEQDFHVRRMGELAE